MSVEPPFAVRVARSGAEQVRLVPSGALDVASVPELEGAVEAARHEARVVVVDLREVTFMDSTGVHLLLRIDAASRADGFSLVVVQGDEHVRELMRLTGVDSVLRVVDEPPEPG